MENTPHHAARHRRPASQTDIDVAWDAWNPCGLDACATHETDLHSVRAANWLLMSTPRRVLAHARALRDHTTYAEQNLVRQSADAARPIIPAPAASILVQAVESALDTNTPWTQAQFDRIVRDLADEEDVVAADQMPVEDVCLTVQ